jgi:hypothetical protein
MADRPVGGTSRVVKVQHLLGLSTLPDPDSPDLSDEIFLLGRRIPPCCWVWSSARPLRLYQLATTHANTSGWVTLWSRISQWTCVSRTPSLLSCYSSSPFELSVISCCIWP